MSETKATANHRVDLSSEEVDDIQELIDAVRAGKVELKTNDPDGTMARLALEFLHVRTALGVYEREKANLYRTDGGRVFGDQEHEEREARLLSPLEAAIDRADAYAASVADQARSGLDRLSSHDPLLDLPTDQMTRAAAMRPLMLETLDAMTLDQLAGYGDGIVLSKDQVQQLILARYIRQRIAQPAVPGAVVPPGLYRRLHALPARLEEASGHSRRPEREQMARRLVAAEDVRRAGREAWDRATDTYAKLKAYHREHHPFAV